MQQSRLLGLRRIYKEIALDSATGESIGCGQVGVSGRGYSEIYRDALVGHVRFCEAAITLHNFCAHRCCWNNPRVGAIRARRRKSNLIQGMRERGRS
jgi:hypothetical protein